MTPTERLAPSLGMEGRTARAVRTSVYGWRAGSASPDGKRPSLVADIEAMAMSLHDYGLPDWRVAEEILDRHGDAIEDAFVSIGLGETPEGRTVIELRIDLVPVEGADLDRPPA